MHQAYGEDRLYWKKEIITVNTDDNSDVNESNTNNIVNKNKFKIPSIKHELKYAILVLSLLIFSVLVLIIKSQSKCNKNTFEYKKLINNDVEYGSFYA